MSHRTWIAVLMNFASLVSYLFNCLIDCPTDDFIDWPIDHLISWLAGVSVADGRGGLNSWPPDWLTGVSGANGRGDEVDDLNDCSTDSSSDGSTRGSSGDSTDDSSDGSTGGSSGCFKFSVMRTCSELSMIEWCSGFSMMRVDCLLIDWFSDEDDETERSEIDDEDLRPKFVFRRILMMMKMKFY